jgi:hypothetical protein
MMMICSCFWCSCREKLSEFVLLTLRQQKGVLLPNLGNFRVGPVVGVPGKKIRPTFALLEGRYGSVSQERGRYIIGEPAERAHWLEAVVRGFHKLGGL